MSTKRYMAPIETVFLILCNTKSITINEEKTGRTEKAMILEIYVYGASTSRPLRSVSDDSDRWRRLRVKLAHPY
jgi:hypothetical protein